MPGSLSRGWLSFGSLRYPCALGKGGVTRAKREGDGATPIASLPIRRVWWRAEHGPRPRTRLPVRRSQPDDGWCDAPADRNYNRPVSLPYSASHETLQRSDALYDLVVELGWNDSPVRKGRGSAIFLHVARPGFQPTEGCVALRARDLRVLLARIGPKTRLVVRG
jgi:L,D-peptidoglycan transpeptidase YkuD (ErfK/YbiS/YcfS/YnhG family)